VSKTICCNCGGVPMGRVTTRAVEYLKEDLTFKEEGDEDDEIVDNCGLLFVFVFMFFEIERDVKENEREKESFTC
jgi:hypothetical protein